MPSKDPVLYLQEIAENIERIQDFTSGMSRQAFLGDEKTVYAVVRALEIVSEASRSVAVAVKARHPAIQWPDIAAAGNIYRHGYASVDKERVWETAQGLSSLLEVVREELAGDAEGSA